MRFVPQHGVGSGKVGAGIIRDRVAAVLADNSVLDLPIGTGVGDVEQLGVPAVGTADTAGVQDLAVSINLFVRILTLNLLERVGPERGAETVMIVGSFDMLRRVKAEAVSARVDQLFHIIIDRCLNTGVLGL